MNYQELPISKVITVKTCTQKPINVEIVDEDDKKYTFFITKKTDGNPTKAFLDFENLDIRPGSKILIAYHENQKEYMGKVRTFNNIVSIKPLLESPENTLKSIASTLTSRAPSRLTTQSGMNTREQDIAWMNAKNCASVITSRALDVGAVDTDTIMSMFEELTKRIYAFSIDNANPISVTQPADDTIPF